MLEPLSAEEFTRDHAAHLLNRAGFGGTPGEIDSFHKMGLTGAVDFLVDYDKVPENYPDPSWSVVDPKEVERFKSMKGMPEPQKLELRKDIYRIFAFRQAELHQWWLERMRVTPRPLQEKMTLFWHSLFATSFIKARNPVLMWQQNNTFRTLATGNWETLLIAMAKDPAMLLWLDGNSSRKDAPNENFAREVMELFTLGEGHYTEDDIKQSARAYAGWHTDLASGQFHDYPGAHDNGPKTFLGQTGNFSGEDILRILAHEPRSSEYVSERLWRYFASEEPNAPIAASLAAEFRAKGLEFKPMLRTLFMSREFYAPEVMRQQVKSPVQWLVSSCRYLERPLPPAVPTLQMMKRLGQIVFMPPSVKGWDTGVSWISTNTLLDRYNFAAVLVQGQPLGLDNGKGKGNRMERVAAKQEKMMEGTQMMAGAPTGFGGGTALTPIDVDKLFPPAVRGSADALLAAMQARCLQSRIPPERLASLKSYLKENDPSNPETIRIAVRLLMSTPDYQLT